MMPLQASCSSSSSLAVGGGTPYLAPPRLRTLVRAKVEPSDKSVEIMRKFSEQYARRSGTYFCVDKGVTSVVIKGLADHKDTLGAPLCPCRKECHCMLFLTPENDFAGTDQAITLDEIKEATANM